MFDTITAGLSRLVSKPDEPSALERARAEQALAEQRYLAAVGDENRARAWLEALAREEQSLAFIERRDADALADMVREAIKSGGELSLSPTEENLSSARARLRAWRGAIERVAAELRSGVVAAEWDMRAAEEACRAEASR